jgi:hypothetical protein
MQLIITDDTTALRVVINGNGKKIELKDKKPSKIYNQEIYHNTEIEVEK